MERPLSQAEFKPQDLRDLGELVDCGVRPAVFEVGQPAQGDPGEFRQVTLTEAEDLPPLTYFFPDFLVRHGHFPLGAFWCVIPPSLGEAGLNVVNKRMEMRFHRDNTQIRNGNQWICAL
jgi:hypothetical protein